MKTKRKLVSKNVVIGSVGESITVGTRGSSLCHVDEGSEAFVVEDNDLGSVPLKRKHMSPDPDQVYRFQPNVGTSSGVHMPTELNGIQLYGTSATHYYLNPNIPETNQLKEFDQAYTLTRNVNEVVAELEDKNPFALPLCLQQLQGTTHIFQFHFNTMNSSRRPDFVLDKVFPTPTLALPQPEPIHTPEPDTTSTYQQTLQQPPTLEEIKQTCQEDYNKELKQSHDSEETVFAHSSEPQITTPPPSKLYVVQTTIEIPAEKDPMGKQDIQKKLPKSSIQKVLFQNQPETTNTPQAVKKQKTEPKNQ
nr:hypothetical protein [Tanacetum cinerariifolium]